MIRPSAYFIYTTDARLRDTERENNTDHKQEERN